jgi:hypothetical protein
VLHADVIGLVQIHTSEKGGDTEWIELMECRVQIISSIMRRSEGKSTGLLIQVDWWSLGHNDLIAQHREPLLHQKEATLRTKQALEAKEITFRQMTQVATPAESSGQHGNGTVQDELAVNSANCSCRDNSTVTQPLALGNTAASPPRTPGNTVAVPPQVPVQCTVFCCIP